MWLYSQIIIHGVHRHAGGLEIFEYRRAPGANVHRHAGGLETPKLELKKAFLFTATQAA